MVQSPIEERMIGGQRLRFFASPIYAASRTPDMPWHVFDDLTTVLGLSDELRTEFLRKLKSDWHQVRTVATPEGIVTIAPHFMGEGLLDLVLTYPAIKPRNETRKIRGQFRNGSIMAMNSMTQHLGPIARFAFAMAALEEGKS